MNQQNFWAKIGRQRKQHWLTEHKVSACMEVDGSFETIRMTGDLYGKSRFQWMICKKCKAFYDATIPKS